jgi:hypothetical protein
MAKICTKWTTRHPFNFLKKKLGKRYKKKRKKGQYRGLVLLAQTLLDFLF